MLESRVSSLLHSPSPPLPSEFLNRDLLGPGVRIESDKLKIGALSPGPHPRFAGGALSGCPGDLGCSALCWLGVEVNGLLSSAKMVAVPSRVDPAVMLSQNGARLPASLSKP